jgi:ATP-binding protein involved in chromosome partitioning
VASHPDSAAARAYRLTARRLAVELAKRPQVATPLSVSLLGD